MTKHPGGDLTTASSEKGTMAIQTDTDPTDREKYLRNIAVSGAEDAAECANAFKDFSDKEPR